MWLCIHSCTRFESTFEKSKEDPKFCNQCDYATSLEGNFSKHLKTHHEEKFSKCNQCDYTSSQKGRLRDHLKKHIRVRLNKCNQCIFASTNASSLRAHLETHSGEKLHKLIRCGFESSYASSLSTHLKIYGEEKSNKCSQCDIWKFTAGKGPTNVTNVSMPMYIGVIWEIIKRCISKGIYKAKQMWKNGGGVFSMIYPVLSAQKDRLTKQVWRIIWEFTWALSPIHALCVKNLLFT